MVTAALGGALFGAGIVAVFAATRPDGVAPPLRVRRRPDRAPRSRLARGGAAAAVGVVTLGVTGWPVATFAAALFAGAAPGAWAARRRNAEQLATVEAIAAWTEMLRDAVASGRGVQEAVAVTAPLAPAGLRPATLALRARSVRGPLPPALRAFADEVADPMADLVAATLTLAATREVRELSDLLGSLAHTTRQRAGLRLTAEAGRAGMRTTARAIAAMTMAVLAGLVAFQPGYLSPYTTPLGQLVAIAAAAWFALGFWGLARLGRPPAPRRLHLKEIGS